jgi:two-component system chemotaxis response regulator CheB
MLLETIGANKRIAIVDANASDKVNYKPSVDLTFSSLAKAYGGDVLGIILTGMGADGREGCRMLKEKGATIWAQDQDSCVVYGMPQAVAVANISSKNINIDDMSSCVQTEMR